MNDAQTDVLVVGAGPTGLTLASELLRHGLTVRIVDAAAEPSPWSKAVVVHARTLEALAQMGRADALIARGRKLRGATLWSNGEALVRADFDELDTAYPFALCVPQSDTEAVLGEALGALGGAVERGVSLAGFRQDGSGVTARLTRDEEALTARASWLVGCDGAHSAVRKALGLPFEGSTYEERFLLADLRVDWDTRDDRISTWFAEDGLAACFPLPSGLWRVVLSGGEDGAEAPTLDEVEAAFSRRTGLGAKLSDLAWSSRFRVHCRQVGSYRDDRVLLAGDAAHIHSPAGGQGMNTGMQDAHNLAWKLAMVHRGHARSKLLDTYHAERHAAGQAVLRGTDAAMRAATVKGALARGVRDEVARFLTGLEVVQQRVANEVSELSVHYENGPLSQEHTTSVLQARIGTAAGGETPTVGSVRAFDKAPAAGRRARDGRATVAGEPGTRTLFEALDTRRFNVLLFDGRSDSAEGYQRFASVAAAVRERHAGAVDVTVVTPRATRPAELPEELAVVLDPDGELEARYGAATECAYVLRPDLYVGYRAQPLDEAKLLAWLDAWLRPET
jgi:2-polyprenyl-6-methoxyphenol hydroxylase-like FAD-dependent oxidoreductase